MHQLVTRRQLLKHSVAAVAGVVACGTLPEVARAIEPIRRSAGPKFKFSLAAYSYRNLLSGDNPRLTLADFIDDCAAMQLEGTELTSYYFPPQPTTEYLLGLKERCFRLGLEVSGTAVGNDFCHPPGDERDAEIAQVKRWVDHAAVLGAPVIRIFSGRRRGDQSIDDAHRLAVDGIQQCCEYAGTRGVYLALENHGGLTDTAEGTLRLVREVESPWFGVNLDTGNFHTSDIYGDLARLAPYAVNVQVKVVIQPEGSSKQPADFNRLAHILRDTGYRGYIVLEYEESGDPREECPKYVEKLREAFG